MPKADIMHLNVIWVEEALGIADNSPHILVHPKIGPQMIEGPMQNVLGF